MQFFYLELHVQSLTNMITSGCWCRLSLSSWRLFPEWILGNKLGCFQFLVRALTRVELTWHPFIFILLILQIRPEAVLRSALTQLVFPRNLQLSVSSVRSGEKTGVMGNHHSGGRWVIRLPRQHHWSLHVGFCCFHYWTLFLIQMWQEVTSATLSSGSTGAE